MNGEATHEAFVFRTRMIPGPLGLDQQVSWLPDLPWADLPARELQVLHGEVPAMCSGSSVFVPGYSGGGRVGVSPASLLSGASDAFVVIARTHCSSRHDSTR